jgi:transcriptional regulator with XRE-family HTH domain
MDLYRMAEAADIKPTFGNLLRLARTTRRVTTRVLAEAMGYRSHVSIVQIERGAFVPPIEAVRSAERLLEVDDMALLWAAGYAVRAEDLPEAERRAITELLKARRLKREEGGTDS